MKPKGFIFIVGIIFIVIFGMAFRVAYHHYQYAVDRALRENKTAANLLAFMIQEHEKAAIGIIQAYASRLLFIQAIKEKDMNGVLRHLTQLKEKDPEIDAVFVTDKDGTLRVNLPTHEESHGKNFSFRDWYKGVSKEWQPYVSSVFKRIVDEGGPAVAACTPILDEKGEVIGILGTSQRTPFLGKIINQFRLDHNRDITLMDQSGHIIYNTRLPGGKDVFNYPHLSLLRKATEEEKEQFAIPYSASGAGKSLVVFAPVKGIGWSLIVEQEGQEVLKSEHRYFGQIAAIFILLFLLLTLSLAYFRRQFIHRKTAELLHVEKELREKERRYSSVLENLNMIAVGLDVNGKITFANPLFLRLTGYAIEEVLEKNWFDTFIPEKIQEEVRYVFREFLEKKRYSHYENPILTKSSSERYVIWSNTHLTDMEGKIIGAISIGEDFTDHRRAEEALRESEERFRATFEQAAVGIAHVAPNGRFLRINKRFCDILGYAPEEMLGRSFQDITHPDDLEADVAYVKQVLSGMIPTYSMEKRYIRKDGSLVWVNLTVAILHGRDGQPKYFISVVEDITERKRLEEQFRQSQKMEAIGRLAGGVAHDFNNLLTIIQGNADFVMMSLKESDPIRQDVKEIQTAAVRAAKLARQLLLFSRKQPMELTSLNINEAIEGLLKMLERLIGEDVAIHVNLEPNLWMTRADTGNIEQVITNLVVNARDAMTEGGIITIKTENSHIDEHYCKAYTYARTGKFVCVSISDNGIGMDKEILQHIFEPFFTTKGVEKGTGLGLSVVYGIIKHHEGWINVYSEPGKGSIFRIYLPAFSAKAEEEIRKTISPTDFRGKGERILMVEDDEGIRRFATRVLRENGYLVFEAAIAKEALSIFEREEGKFDLVFADVVLPDKNGVQLTAEIVTRKPGLKVLLASGYTDDKSRFDSIRERGFRFIQKPYKLTELLRIIKDAIGKGR